VSQRNVALYLAGAALILAALTQSCVAATTDSQDVEAPQAAFERFIAAFNALDWSSFRACFADDASVFNPDIPQVVSLHRLDGRAAIERTFRAVFEATGGETDHPGPHIVPENVRVQRFNDTAIVTFEFKRPNASFGRRTVVLHQQGARWLIVHLHASNITRSPHNR